MRIKFGTLKKLIKETLSEGEMCSECGLSLEACGCQMDEVAPPHREKQVKGLKKHMKKGDVPKTYIDKKTGKRKESNPWALAWAQHKKHGAPKK